MGGTWVDRQRKHVSPKRTLVNPQDKAKMRQESDRSLGGEKATAFKVEVAVSLFKTTLILILF